MAINYCDWVVGDDVTGDGTFGSPYKTITTASTGISGGDEVRVAKSPEDTDLSGTLDFVNNSTSVATSVDLTGELNIYDLIFKDGNKDYLMEIIALNATTLTLRERYYGTTETASAKKIGITDTGHSEYTDKVQEVSSSGISEESRLKISGGWNLSNQTQDGQTFFQQVHLTYGSRYGIGLTIDDKSHLEIEKLGFLKYNIGIIIEHTGSMYNNSRYNLFNDVVCDVNLFGFNIDSCNNNTINNLRCSCNSYWGLRISGNYNLINFPTCNFIRGVGETSGMGIYLENSNENIILSPICNNNQEYGICCINNNDIINKFSGEGNSYDISMPNYNKHSETPHVFAQHFKVTGDNRCYYDYFGVTYRDITEARSDQCLKFKSKSNTYYIRQDFSFGVLSGDQPNISFYIKDNSSFNGDVQAALFFMEENITGWNTISTTENYIKHTLVAQSTDITEEGVVDLRIKVRGSNGNVYVDDLGVI